jgi:plastocyanin
MRLGDPARRLDATDARHVEVHQHDIGLGARDHLERLLPRRHGVGLLVAISAGVIVYNQHASVGAPVAGVHEVRVDLGGYAPRAIEVPAGTTVTWRFDDGIVHDVVGDGFTSPQIDKGTWSHTVTTSGTYEYHCSLHPIMRGRVVVTGTATPGTDGR